MELTKATRDQSHKGGSDGLGSWEGSSVDNAECTTPCWYLLGLMVLAKVDRGGGSSELAFGASYIAGRNVCIQDIWVRRREAFEHFFRKAKVLGQDV